eukprot:gene6118-8115_t
MERSAQGVVEGTRLSDRAGLALKDINQLSEDVSARIEQIATVASKEADSANAVANSMQGIVSLIEQTSHGTQLNADKVRGLRSAADDLRDGTDKPVAGTKDLGSLVWVLSDLRQLIPMATMALRQAARESKSVARMGEGWPQDSSLLAAQHQYEQAAGALAMVGQLEAAKICTAAKAAVETFIQNP